MTADAELATDLGAALARHQGVQPARQFALWLIREELEQPVGDGEAEHTIAEEFEPLVMTVAMRGMGERALEHRGIARRAADRGFEPCGVTVHQYVPPIRLQRVAESQVQGFDQAALPSVEKNTISARPIRLSPGR